MKKTIPQRRRTRFIWRPSVDLRDRFEEFLAENAPADLTQYFEAALTFYLDEIDRYGMHNATLRPKRR